jgi:predicted molibdopterin-dependent oxidoreductase YjgC
LALSDVIVVDGVDLARQLPTIGGCVLRAQLRGATLIVIDSRRHAVARSADLFLQLLPGTDAMLYGAMAKVILDRGLRDLHFIRQYCRGYPAFLDELATYDLATAAEVCGVPADKIEAAALAYAQARRAAILYSTGIESRGSESIQAIVNLVLLTGHIGREGAGLYALTEHNNLQGVCDMGMLPDFLPGYAPVEDCDSRHRLERLWAAPLPAQPGCGARAVLSAGAESEHRIRALWLGRYDPVRTAFFGDARQTLHDTELVVVQHLFLTDTARLAHVVLPTTAYGEESVSFTSTDRRVQLARKVLEPVEGPRPAWAQIAELSRRLGSQWEYLTASDVMDEIGAAVPFYGGASHENLAREYGRQWPCTRDKPLGTRFVYEDGLPADRPFRFIPVNRPTPAVDSAEYPFSVVFGHSLYYWHQNVLIQHSETLKREYHILLLDYPKGFVEVNADDAQRLGIRDGDPVRLCAPGGQLRSTARVTDEVRTGTICIPYFVREVEQQLTGDRSEGREVMSARLEKDLS